MNGISRLLLGAAVLAAACQGKQERSPEETAAIDSARAAADDSAAQANSKELKVSSVMIGRQIGANDLITQPTFQFAPTDTVFLSVATVGSPDSAALSAVVIGQNGKVVDSTSQTIKPEGHATTAFRNAPDKGWKPGTYRVTLYADGDSVDAKTFAVQK
jgi:lysophospholipase L1-like esterase